VFLLVLLIVILNRQWKKVSQIRYLSDVFIVPYVIYVYYGLFGSYVGLLQFIGKIAILITVVLALVISNYLQLEQDNKSRKSF